MKSNPDFGAAQQGENATNPGKQLAIDGDIKSLLSHPSKDTDTVLDEAHHRFIVDSQNVIGISYIKYFQNLSIFLK